MITFLAKLPSQRFCRHSFYGIARLNCTVRAYSNNPSQTPICPPPKPKKKEPSSGTKYTIGALTLVSLATIGYANYDPEFRKFLGENVPGADTFFKVIFQEERPISDSIGLFYGRIKDIVMADKKKNRKLQDKEADYTPPRAVFPSLAKDGKEEEKFSEIRLQKEDKTVCIVEDTKPKGEQILSEYHPKNVGELELKIGEAAKLAVDSFAKAHRALHDYNQDIETIVEKSVEKLEPKIWESLKEKTERKNEILKSAEENAKKATKDMQIFSSLLNDKELNVPDAVKANVRRNIDRLLDDITQARRNYEKEVEIATVTEKYWKKVEQARCHFIDELEILFPDFDIDKKKFHLKPSDLDLFLVHVFATVLYYQKELYRVENMGQLKLKQAVEAARKGDPNFSIVETAINEGIEKEKRKLREDFAKKCLELRKESEKELRHRMKCQEQAHIDHLNDVVAQREQELEREFNRKLDEQAVTEQAKYKMQMAGMIARMKGMKNAILERVEADKIAHQSQVLWSACQSLHRAVKTSTPGVPWTKQIRPLESEVDAIRKAAAEGDELVQIVLSGIPDEAVARGVYPEGAIRERFLKVERVARRVALVPAEGARLPIYLLSFLQASLLMNANNPIPQAELANETTDFTKLDTYDILQRARYWIDRGNYTQTLKYMNLLKGAARCVALDWMRETRILLETQQAAETLMAHAVAGGLLHL